MAKGERYCPVCEKMFPSKHHHGITTQCCGGKCLEKRKAEQADRCLSEDTSQFSGPRTHPSDGVPPLVLQKIANDSLRNPQTLRQRTKTKEQ